MPEETTRSSERATERHEEPADAALDGAESGEAVEQWEGRWEGLFPKKHPLVVVNTGNGKGKTTAALGVTMRAWGRGWKICWLQFIKSKTSNYGETRAAKRMGIEMIPLGDGFTWLSKDIEKDIALAHECWDLAREKINSGLFDLVVLDEITYPITYGWLDVDEVLEVLRNRPKDVDIIITGRDAHAKLIDFADTVTEMTEVKHAFQSGTKAQPGIDF